MSGFGISLLGFIVAISVLVAVHEFGHYWVARRLGIRVLRFSIGFGKPLWRRRFGADNTEFVIAALPLGGYVKMLDEREAPVAEPEAARAFNRQPLRVRSAVIVAGPMFNFLFAIAAYWLMFVSGVPGLRPVVGEVTPQSVAAEAGFRERDELLSVAGRQTPSWDAATLELLDAALARDSIEIRVREPDDRQRVLVIDFGAVSNALDKGGLLDNLGLAIWRPTVPAVIDRLVAGAPAEQAGLLPGDRVVAVDDKVVESWSEWVAFVRAHPGETLRIRVERGGQQLELSLVPRAVEEKGTTIGQIGAYVREPEGLRESMRTEVRYGLLESTGKAVVKTWDMTALTVRTLWGMISGQASVENISGPISIAQYAGYSVSVGLASFLKFLAIVSVSLGVLNLLPIPILDGGHLLYNIIEWLRGKPLSEHAQQIGQQLGILLLLALMSIAFYNDLSRLFGA
ncbi:MAG: RIP metalloprotease RseP [Gammaproteobacteria bacterium]|nr:MAG: RIP metalloprotease RseP [Gammaproteobacteria bacterium]